MSISAREGRQIDKGRLILLDNCCNLQVSNIRSLFNELTENTSGSANTLGGKYSPSMKGFSEHIGYALFDEECDVTVLSYKKLMDQNRIVQRDKYVPEVVNATLNSFLHEDVPEDDFMNYLDECLYVGDAANASGDPEDHFHQHLGVYASMEIDHLISS